MDHSELASLVNDFFKTHPLPNKNIVNDGSSAENNAQANKNWSNDRRDAIEMQKHVQNDSWNMNENEL